MDHAALQGLLDEHEIHKLFIRMSNGMDLRDFAMFRSAWADEVELDIPPMGGDSIRLSGKLSADVYSNGVITMLSEFAVTQHCSINHLIEVAGDTATGMCYTFATHYLAIAMLDPWNTVGARYDFTARRLSQGWRIEKLKWTRLWSSGNEGLWPEVARRVTAREAAEAH